MLFPLLGREKDRGTRGNQVEFFEIGLDPCVHTRKPLLWLPWAPLPLTLGPSFSACPAPALFTVSRLTQGDTDAIPSADDM